MTAERQFVLPDEDTTGFVDPDTLPTPLAVSLDWSAYFKNFKEVHGEPVLWKGKLLFPDGWTYSCKSREGPEWPPPAKPEQLHELQICYWLTRLSIVQAEFNTLQDMLINLRQLQASRSLPLQCSTSVYDEELGSHRAVAVPLNLDEIEHGRLAWLREDIAMCQDQLRQLNTPAVMTPHDSLDRDTLAG